MSPSYNRSYLAYRIAKLLDKEERFNFHIEMTLDIAGVDYIPDIAVYDKKPSTFCMTGLRRTKSRCWRWKFYRRNSR